MSSIGIDEVSGVAPLSARSGHRSTSSPSHSRGLSFDVNVPGLGVTPTPRECSAGSVDSTSSARATRDRSCSTFSDSSLTLSSQL